MRPTRLLSLAAALTLLARPAPAYPATIELDGLRDASYVLIAEDPAGDLPPDSAINANRLWADLTRLYVAHNETHLFVYADLPDYEPAHAAGEIGLAFLLPGGTAAGERADPYSPTKINYAYAESTQGLCPPTALGATRHPDVLIRGHIKGMDDGFNVSDGNTWRATSGATEWENDDVEWGGINSLGVEDRLAYGVGAGVELSIPWADLGLSDPASLQLSFFTAAIGPGEPGVLDVIPSGSATPTSPTSTVLSRLQFTPLPLPSPASASLGCGTHAVAEDAGTASLIVHLNGVLTQSVAVSYTASALTAGPADFTPLIGTASFLPGVTRQAITVPLVDDALDEQDETFSVTLSNPQGLALVSPLSATVTIVDDDEGGPAHRLYVPLLRSD